MKKTLFVILALVNSFSLGFALKAAIDDNANPPEKLKRVTGGGIFFKCKDPKTLKEWYKTHLGFYTDEYGTVFAWYKGSTLPKKVLHNGAPLMKKQSISNLPLKILCSITASRIWKNC